MIMGGCGKEVTADIGLPIKKIIVINGRRTLC